ncbi:MAG: DNA methyltransferase, partial [Polyangiaceae bacterium]
ARAVLSWVPDPGLVIFFQSDIRANGAWVDKGYLVQRAAEAEGRTLLWHKIVCRHAPGSISHGRANYSHLLCFARAPRERVRHPGPDVLPDAGFKPWSKAMGVEACRLACRFLREESETKIVVDPFCGHGTALAVANRLGFDALGVELSTRKVRAAKRLELPAEDE